MLKARIPDIKDLKLYYNWVNDPDVRLHSYDSEPIDYNKHKKWFEAALNDKSLYMYIFENMRKEMIGQVRIKKQNFNQALIGLSVATEHRGLGYAKEMLIQASDIFLSTNPKFSINAYIKEGNIASKVSFEKAGFVFQKMMLYNGFMSFHYIKEYYNENR